MGTATMAITGELRTAWRFFLEHAGHASPPGRAACALALARAEMEAQRMGLAFVWEHDDDDSADGDVTPETRERCRCIGRDNDTLASLGSIGDATDDYRRVVEAELAMEALAWIGEQPSTLPTNRDGNLSAYAWPGGYPIHYHTADGGTLCPMCANREASEWHTDKQWRLIGADVYWEGAPIQCDHCGAEMESAYGDPDAQDD